MAKGLAQRRRLKRALDAARGNLHKISNGKALPVALPEAPKPQDAERLPASLRKMLALKELADKQDRKARPKGTGAGSSAGGRRGPKPESAGRKDEDNGSEGPSTSGRTHAAAEETGHPESAKGSKAIKGANAFTEQFVEKKLKAKKKEYLKRKQEKRRMKASGGDLVVEKELQLRDKVKFGEVVHAPLNVQLKRKHWAEKEKTVNERCKEVFLKQMQHAQQRMAGQAADEGLQVPGGRKAGLGTAAGGPVHMPGAHGKKRKAQPDQETEELRQQVIESYRAAKKGSSLHTASVGNATLSSLASLVGKSAGGKAVAKTHTLA